MRQPTTKHPTRRLLWCLLTLTVALFVLGPPALAQGAPDESIRGTLRSEGSPVPGVLITVTEPDGDEVGADTSGEDGSWEVPVPGPGDYVVTLDVETLPEGVSLADPAAASRPITVRTNQRRAIIIPLAGGVPSDASPGDDAPAPRPDRGGPTFLDRLAQTSLNGVKFGLIIAMSAIGLSLVFGTTGLINFAHGELVTAGAVVAWWLNTSGPQLGLVAAAILAIALVGAGGAGLELGVFRPLRRRRLGLFQLLVITIGLSLLVRHVILLFFGGRSRPFTQYVIQSQWHFGPFAITPRDLFVMAMSVVILVGVATMLQRTRLGKAMRAVSDNVDLAESSGINVPRVILSVWVLGAGLAATGGVFLGAVETVNWMMGFRLLLLMFAAVILGGLGTAYGAMLGALVIGLVTEISTIWFSPELKFVWALAALVVVLLVRPTGILGIKERIG